MNTLKIGTFVKSKKGRDVNNVYIVKNINNKYVELVDGKGKTLENAKIKNLKHLEILEKHSEKLQEKFEKNKKVFNEEIYSAIRKYMEE